MRSFSSKEKGYIGMYMQKKNETTTLAFVAAVVLALLSSVAFAQSQCLTDVSTTTSTSRATTGTSVTITATTTGSSCTVSTLSLVSTPALTVNDPASGQYSGFSAGTAKSFTVTGGTADTYTYYARGTTSSGSVDSTQQILEFISPSDLTVTATPSSASVSSGQTFSLTINMQNPQSSAVTTSYAINMPSGLSRNSGDPLTSSGTTVSGSSTKTLSLTVKHSTCFTGTKTITFDVGGSTNVASVSVTGNSTCDSGSSGSSSSSSGGGGGAGAGGAAVASEAHTFAQISPGAVAVKKLTNTNIGVKEISIEVNNLATNVRLTVTKLAGQPASVTTPKGTVYQFVEINASNVQGNLKSAALTFEVTKGWLLQNGFEKAHVALQRFANSAWENLPTTVISEDSSVVKYQATTSGFSVFAIAADKTAAQTTQGTTTTQANQTGQPSQPSQPETTQAPGQQPASQPLIKLPPLDSATLSVLVVTFIVVLGAAYFMLTKRKKSSIFPSK